MEGRDRGLYIIPWLSLGRRFLRTDRCLRLSRPAALAEHLGGGFVFQAYSSSIFVPPLRFASDGGDAAIS
jgi:hypothetical protein